MEQMDDSHPYMMDLETNENDPLLMSVKNRLKLPESHPYMMDLEMNENDPLLMSVKNRLKLPESSDHMEFQWRKNHLARESSDSESSESSDIESVRKVRKVRKMRKMRKMPYRWMQIQKVPEMFRRNESSAKHYTPMVVSIGPYHHGSKELAGMEETKTQMTADFIKKSEQDAEGLDDAFKRLHNVVVPHALWAMEVYDDGEPWSKNLEPDRLATIMFRDGCFVLEFIRYVVLKPESLPMNSHIAALVMRDLFLLENQLPFGVLISLMKSSKKYNGKKGMEYIDKFLTQMSAFPPPRREWCSDQVSKCPLSRCLPPCSTNPEKGNNARVNPQYDTHLLGLFQKRFIKNNMELRASPHTETLVDDQEKGWYRYRAAMELKRVGIEFEPAGTKLFTDIHFTSTLLGGKLKIPRLTIHESTTPLILNLVAYEASLNASDDFGVTSYICFMDSLIDRGEDITELRSKEILFHTLGSDEQVAKLFSDIANNLVPNPKAYSEVKRQIESYYRSDFKVWYNRYNSKIYSAFWMIVGLGTAIFGALKAFTSLTISPVPGLQLPGFCKF